MKIYNYGEFWQKIRQSPEWPFDWKNKTKQNKLGGLWLLHMIVIKLISMSCFSSFACRFAAVWGSGLDGKPSGSSYWERLRVCLWSMRTTTTRARSSSLHPQTSRKRLITFATRFPVHLCSTVHLILVKYHNKTLCYYSVSCDSILSLNFSLVYYIIQIFVTL